MTDRSDSETVDRSRLRLLGVLTAAGAVGACGDNTSDPLAGLKTGLTRTGQTKEQQAEARRIAEIRRKEEAKRKIYPWDNTEERAAAEEFRRLNSGGEGGGGGGGSH